MSNTVKKLIDEIQKLKAQKCEIAFRIKDLELELKRVKEYLQIEEERANHDRQSIEGESSYDSVNYYYQ